ncbi:MAG: RpiB/LacA/LacB family sugar-phosphate isomerase [Syntrophothermus sp.]
MKIGIAADHGGYELKELISQKMKESGYSIVDYGAFRHDPDDDYPDYIIPLARAVASGQMDRGIAICGSGVGASIAANKIPGVRAALVTDIFSAHQGVEDDNMNIICFGGKVSGPSVVWELIQAFLAANFSGWERHQRRLGKILELEKKL